MNVKASIKEFYHNSNNNKTSNENNQGEAGVGLRDTKSTCCILDVVIQ